MTVAELHQALAQIVTRNEPSLSEQTMLLQTPDGPYEVDHVNIEHYPNGTTKVCLVGDIPQE